MHRTRVDSYVAVAMESPRRPAPWWHGCKVEAALATSCEEGAPPACAWQPCTATLTSHPTLPAAHVLSFEPPVLRITAAWRDDRTLCVRAPSPPHAPLLGPCVRVNKLQYHPFALASDSLHEEVALLSDACERHVHYWALSSCVVAMGPAGELPPHVYPEEHADLVRLAKHVKANTLYANLAASRIQRAWRRAVGCPEYAVCVRRLQREFVQM